MSIKDNVSLEELTKHINTIATWVRLSGTEDEAKAFDYVQETLEKFGFTTSRYLSDALIGYPGPASLTIAGDDSVSFTPNGYALSPRTGDEGVTGELIFVGDGTPADLQGVDLQGKIIVSEGLANPGKSLAVQNTGAIGHIHIDGPLVRDMCISPVWGVPTPETAHLLPDIPAVGINEEEGKVLKEKMKAGTVVATLVTQPFLEWGKLPTLIADLPGNEEDTYVLFSGHIDSWYYGAMDNGSANATQIEIGRLLAENRDWLRRGLRLAFWSGHSHARYAGSAWYADEFWTDLHRRCVCHVNVDSVGGLNATVLEDIPTMAETHGFGAELLRDLAGVELPYNRMGRFSDQSFWGHGIPALFATFSAQETERSDGEGPRGGGLGWWWHTPQDTPDKIDPENLLRDARIYAEALWRLCTDERLPFDQKPVARELLTALELYQDQAGDHLDLSSVIDAANQLVSMLERLNLGALPAEAANAFTMEMSRILLPVNYTAKGPFEHDLAVRSLALPGLYDVRKLATLDPATSDYHFLRTRLARERNRIEHALLTALDKVQELAG